MNISSPVTTNTSQKLYYSRDVLLKLNTPLNSQASIDLITILGHYNVLKLKTKSHKRTKRGTRAGKKKKQEIITVVSDSHHHQQQPATDETSLLLLLTPPPAPSPQPPSSRRRSPPPSSPSPSCRLSQTLSSRPPPPPSSADLTVGLINAQSCRNKTVEIIDVINDNSIDVMCIVESWLRNYGDEITLQDLTPPGYVTHSFPRRQGRGGGIAIIHKDTSHPKIKCRQTSHLFHTFESVEVSVSGKERTTKIVTLYRPPKSVKNKASTSDFINELTEMITMYDIENHDYAIIGDFNIHLDRQTPEVTKIQRLFDEHNLTQHVQTATHKHGHILDWIITSEHIVPVTPVIVSDECISDHYLLHFSVPLSTIKQTKSKRKIVSRHLQNIDLQKFKKDLSSEISTIPNIDTISFNEVSRRILDQHAPLTEKLVKERKPSPWYSTDVRKAKCEKRRAEAKWRKTKLCVHRQIYIYYKNKYKKEIQKAKGDHFRKKLNEVKDSKQFFQLTSSLLGKPTCRELPSHDNGKELAERFSEYFIKKISNIRESLDQHDTETIDHSFTGEKMEIFDEVTVDDLKQLILSSPSKSCELDPIPTNLLKSSIEEVSEAICLIVNKSLKSGVFPELYKTAIVTPLLKKHGLDPDDLKNYRPVSNLSFLSKLLERIVLKQLTAHLSKNGLQEPFQSAYRKNHSTETALTRVVDDLTRIIDSGDTSILCLLDLSAAFDTLDHTLLLERLQKTFGLNGIVLNWFRSYLKNRTLTVSIGGEKSDEKEIHFGVPQGSVLGPVLFVMYTTPLAQIIRKHELSYHMYADDTQIYDTNTSKQLTKSIEKCDNCVRDIKLWMDKNRLQLNSDKTEVLVVGSQNNLKKLEQSIV